MRSMIQRIDPPLELTTAKGKVWAHFLIDYGVDYDLLWVCFAQDTGECWTFRNDDIRLCENITMHRTYPRLRPHQTQPATTSKQKRSFTAP